MIGNKMADLDDDCLKMAETEKMAAIIEQKLHIDQGTIVAWILEEIRTSRSDLITIVCKVRGYLKLSYKCNYLICD